MMIREILRGCCAGVLMMLIAGGGGMGTVFGADSEPEPEPEPVKTESGLLYVDLVEGSGQEAQSGDTVIVHYTGWLEDGTKFDSSVDRGKPLSFKLGVGRVIKGWDEGVVGMRIGTKRKLTIPSHLGYGSRGAGRVIPPDATLIFEVELLELK